MGAAARFGSVRTAILAGILTLVAACGDSSSTSPPTVEPTPPRPTPSASPATTVGLSTPFDSAAPLIRRAGDSQPTAIAVQLRDSAGRPVRQAGRELRLSVLDLAGQPNTRISIRSGATALTDTGGIARISGLVLSGRAGEGLIAARIDTLPPVTFPFRLLAGPVSPTATAVTLAPDTVPVGGAAQLVVLPMDGTGNKLGAGQRVSAALDGDPALAAISPFAFTESDSTYRATITVLAVAPTRPLRVRVDDIPLTLSLNFTGIAAPPPPPRPAVAVRMLALPGDTLPAYRVASGAIWPSVTLQLIDNTGAAVAQAGIAIAGRAVTTAGQPLPNATLAGASAVSTNASGQAVFPAVALTAPAGVSRVVFESTNLASFGLPVQILPGAVSATRSTLTASRDTLFVDSTLSVRVTPRDAAGSALGTGQTVVLTMSGGTSAGTFSAVIYNSSDSSYSATLTGTTAGTTSTVRASVNATPLVATASVTVRIRGGVVVPASPVSLTPDSIPVGGASQFVTTPIDANGRKLGAGQTVSVALSGGSSAATIDSIAYSAGDSSYRASITGVTAGTTTTATTTVNGVVLLATRPLTVTSPPPPPPDPATALGITTLPGDTTAGGLDLQSGALVPSVTVSLRSANGTVIAQGGVPVTVTAINANGDSLAGATLTGNGPLSTEANGTVAFTSLRLTAPAGTARLRFNSPNLTPVSFPVRLRAGVVSGTTSTFVLSADNIAIGANSVATITARDATGNKLGSGQTVTLAQAGGTSVVSIGAVTYRASDSTYGGTISGVTAGTARTLTATVNATALATTRTITVTPAVPVDITATVNGASTFDISRFIYGVNFADDAAVWGNTTPPADITLNRFGGNRLTAYNWENNYSNAGSDFQYNNDQYLSSSTTPGAAVSTRATATFNRGQAFMATIPMLGYVSADAAGSMGITDADRTNRLATRFRMSRAAKGSAFTTTPNANDGFVYQDEFVNWFESRYPGRTTNPTAPVFYSLDNEPDIWHSTHKEIQSNINDNPNTERLQTYSALSDTSAVYARAIKAVVPNAIIFGPATATYAGVTLLGRITNGTIFPDPVYGSQNFFDVYLQRMQAASTQAGRRLLDVLDLHFYSEATAGGVGILNDRATQTAAMVDARVQAPRSLWDPTYRETSWVADVAGGPIRLIPRLKAQIAANYPGTRLAITEYSYGRTGDIAGGVAQADALGIFGREGLFAATLWPLTDVSAPGYNGSGATAYAYCFGAFRMYRNYDGAGNSFGDIGLAATTSNVAQSSIYASRTSSGRIVIIAINKTTTSKVVNIALTAVGTPTVAQVYTMVNGSPNPTRQADVPVGAGGITYTMPAMSVTTLAMIP
jgi:hypothetical protein